MVSRKVKFFLDLLPSSPFSRRQGKKEKRNQCNRCGATNSPLSSYREMSPPRDRIVVSKVETESRTQEKLMCPIHSFASLKRSVSPMRNNVSAASRIVIPVQPPKVVR